MSDFVKPKGTDDASSLADRLDGWADHEQNAWGGQLSATLRASAVALREAATQQRDLASEDVQDAKYINTLKARIKELEAERDAEADTAAQTIVNVVKRAVRAEADLVKVREGLAKQVAMMRERSTVTLTSAKAWPKDSYKRGWYLAWASAYAGIAKELDALLAADGGEKGAAPETPHAPAPWHWERKPLPPYDVVIFANDGLTVTRWTFDENDDHGADLVREMVEELAARIVDAVNRVTPALSAHPTSDHSDECEKCGGGRYIYDATKDEGKEWTECPACRAEAVIGTMGEPKMCEHDWRFDGDDPYLVCAKCRERRDAISGRVIEAGRTPAEKGAERE